MLQKLRPDAKTRRLTSLPEREKEGAKDRTKKTKLFTEDKK